MEARGYHGGEGRTRLKELKFAKLDYAAFIASALILALAVVSRIYF